MKNLLIGAAVSSIMLLSACGQAEDSNKGTTSASPSPSISQETSPKSDLAKASEAAGCTGYVQSTEVAPFAAEWGTCTFSGGKVQAYRFSNDADYKSFLDAANAWGVSEEWLVYKDLVAFAPDDQTQIPAMKKKLGIS